MKRLEGKVAIITGSSSGFGRAIAINYAAEGAKVVCSDIKKSHADNEQFAPGIDTDDFINSNGGDAIYEQINIMLSMDALKELRGSLKAMI